MNNRTLYKRESRFWKLEIQRLKRDTHYRWVRKDGATLSGQTLTQTRKWLHVRRLYHSAYRQVHGKIDLLQVRSGLSAKVDKAWRRKTAAGNRAGYTITKT